MENGISGWLQYHYKTCCEKGGHPGSAGLYVLEVVSPWEHYFQIGGLAYNRGLLYLIHLKP